MTVLTISRFAAMVHPPTREPLTWQQLGNLFSDPRRTACTVATCLGSGCPHKNGACWSPAAFRDDKRVARDIEGISCLALDVDHASDATVATMRGHLGRYQHLIHATHGDRPDDRCLRVVVQLTRSVTAREWPRFWRAAVQALRVPADPPVSDMGRLYFLPSRPIDADYFTVVNSGAALDVEALLGTAPIIDQPAVQEGVSP